jgi:hypothetical protein
MKSFWSIPELDYTEIEEERVMITEEQLARTLKLYGANK